MLCGVLLKYARPKNDICPFCGVEAGPRFTVVEEDSKYIMFEDRSPAALQHYLVIPRDHIESVRTLNRTDVELVRGLLAMGERHFDSKDIPKKQRRFGFHVPPFTSVDHLHLHCFVLPFVNPMRSYKFRLSTRNNGRHVKGWGWFIEARQTIEILSNGGSVRIGPC